MGLSQSLRRYAFSRLRAFPVLGWDGYEPWQTFAGLPGVVPARAPHDSDLLVLCGEIPARWENRLRALLETLPLPRAVVWLRPSWARRAPENLFVGRTLPVERLGEMDLAASVFPLLEPRARANQPLLATPAGAIPASAEQLTEPPERRLARRVEDVDHLALDELPLLLGPHFPGLPSGLQLALWLQGDRIRFCESVHNAFPLLALGPDTLPRGGLGNGPALQALLGRPVPIALLERARLRSHLSWMADCLALTGLPGPAAKLRRLRGSPAPDPLQSLLERVERRLRPLLEGNGVIDAAEARRLDLVGPVARACGLAADARADDPDYRMLGYEPVLEFAGDSWARFRLRGREALQSLELIRVAGHRVTRLAEAPRGLLRRNASHFLAPSTALLELLKAGLAGLEWRQALLFLVSLDLSMEEAALQ